MKQITILRGNYWERTGADLYRKLKNLSKEMDWQVVITEYKGNRSVLQNNLLWLWLTFISKWWLETFGEARTPETFKIYFQKLFLGSETIELMGETITALKGTSTLNTKEFSQFLDNLENYVNSEFNIQLPIPDYYGEAMR